MDAKPSPLDIFIGLAIGVLVAAPLSALLLSWGASTLWGWFVQPQYGGGPSMAAWYGLSLIAGLFMHGIARDTSKVNGSVIGTVLLKLLSLAVGVVLTVGIARLVLAMAF